MGQEELGVFNTGLASYRSTVGEEEESEVKEKCKLCKGKK